MEIVSIHRGTRKIIQSTLLLSSSGKNIDFALVLKISTGMQDPRQFNFVTGKVFCTNN